MKTNPIESSSSRQEQGSARDRLVTNLARLVVAMHRHERSHGEPWADASTDEDSAKLVAKTGHMR